jgi:hypothetical protein
VGLVYSDAGNGRASPPKCRCFLWLDLTLGISNKSFWFSYEMGSGNLVGYLGVFGLQMDHQELSVRADLSV